MTTKPKSNFIKSLLLHIRYPWTALVILILWIGIAILCMIEDYPNNTIILLTGISGIATLILALIGFKG